MSLAHDRVSRWLQGRALVSAEGEVVLGERRGPALVQKLARAYDWIATHVLVTSYDDIEFGPARRIGRAGTPVALPAGPRWCSFILVPLLTLVTGQRLLIIGGPGRGKTSIAMLMAMLVGYSPAEVRRMVQRGHPQLTVADLLGSPLPSELIKAQVAEEVRVAWRRWLTQRVKVIDEYNRIPTKTQSALLSLMAEGCAEMFEQVIEVGPSSWYLTANDDLGGGTFEVIEALRDRIDAAVRCPPYSGRLLDALAARVGDGAAVAVLDDAPPRDLVLTLAELERASAEVRELAVPEDVLDALGFFAGQLDFCARASQRVEYMNKDTLHIAGRRLAHVCNEDCPLDKQQNLCTQAESGVSARAYQSVLLLAKALAWFRSEAAVSIEDVRAVLPWVLHEKLRINPQSAFFGKPEHAVYLTDRVSWIHHMFDAAMAQRAAYARTRAPVEVLRREVGGLAAATDDQVAAMMERLRRALEKLVDQGELNAPVHADVLLLKSLHARCQRALDARRRPA